MKVRTTSDAALIVSESNAKYVDSYLVLNKVNRRVGLIV